MFNLVGEARRLAISIAQRDGPDVRLSRAARRYRTRGPAQ